MEFRQHFDKSDRVDLFYRHQAFSECPPIPIARSQPGSCFLALCRVSFPLRFAATAVSIRQGIRANREAAIAQAVNDFLQNDLLGQASISNQSKPDPDVKVRTALVREPGFRLKLPRFSAGDFRA